jgi:hypothetical protein
MNKRKTIGGTKKLLLNEFTYFSFCTTYFYIPLMFFFRCVFSSTLGLSGPQKYTPIRKVAVQYYKKLIFVCFSIPPPVKKRIQG